MASLVLPLRGQVRARALKLRAYLALTKPRIIELLLVTTVPTMVLAARGLPSGWLVLETLIGGSLAAGGANAYNMYFDRDIDKVMGRTQKRPLVTGEISPSAALVFATVIELAAFVELWLGVNLLSAVLAVSATAFYVGVYTLWLKRSSSQNIVIGGAAGAVPVLVGWAAVTDRLAWPAVLLFAVVFVWTPPHFWALAVRYREDYASVKVPMLPAVTSLEKTARQIVAYTVVLCVVTLVFAWVADMGPVYIATAAVMGAVFVYKGLRLHRELTAKAAMKVFGYSIVYLFVLFASVAVDVIVRRY
ncbi:MAG: heme o synthase [Actinobacteria bacterium]|nr:heme o synthase [Actinomycetota bacterium]